MSEFKLTGTITEILFLVAMWIATAPRVQAQDDQPLRITFSQAVQIPGRVLPAGTYIFQRRMEGFAADENLIQISNSDGTRIITFVWIDDLDKPRIVALGADFESCIALGRQ